MSDSLISEHILEKSIHIARCVFYMIGRWHYVTIYPQDFHFSGFFKYHLVEFKFDSICGTLETQIFMKQILKPHSEELAIIRSCTHLPNLGALSLCMLVFCDLQGNLGGKG
jgi:hypothetical protein